MSGFLRLCASALRQPASDSHGVAIGAARKKDTCWGVTLKAK